MNIDAAIVINITSVAIALVAILAGPAVYADLKRFFARVRISIVSLRAGKRSLSSLHEVEISTKFDYSDEFSITFQVSNGAKIRRLIDISEYHPLVIADMSESRGNSFVLRFSSMQSGIPILFKFETNDRCRVICYCNKFLVAVDQVSEVFDIEFLKGNRRSGQEILEQRQRISILLLLFLASVFLICFIILFKAALLID